MPLLCFVAAGTPRRAFFSFVLCGGSLDWLKLPSPIFYFENNNLNFNIFLGELNISQGKNILIGCSKSPDFLLNKNKQTKNSSVMNTKNNLLNNKLLIIYINISE